MAASTAFVSHRRQLELLPSCDPSRNSVSLREDPFLSRKAHGKKVLDNLFGEEGSNLHCRDQNPMSCQLNDPRPSKCHEHWADSPSLTTRTAQYRPIALTMSSFLTLGLGRSSANLQFLMGSLVKKRRKRMRKKKHKKMLRRTRYQRNK